MAITLKPNVEKRLARVIDEAIELADIGDSRVPARDIAERIYGSEAELIAEISRFWIIDRLMWMVSRRRQARRAQRYPTSQMVLPDPIFQGLPKTIFLRNGQRPKLLHATLTETEDHLKLLRERFKNNPRVIQFEAVVELHRKWATVQRGISLVDAFRREAEERETS